MSQYGRMSMMRGMSMSGMSGMSDGDDNLGTYLLILLGVLLVVNLVVSSVTLYKQKQQKSKDGFNYAKSNKNSISYSPNNNNITEKSPIYDQQKQKSGFKL